MKKRGNFFSSIHFKWLFLVTGLIFLSVILSGLVLLRQTRRVVYENIYSSTQNTANMAAMQIRQEVRGVYTDLQLLATTPAFLSFERDGISNALKNQLMQNIFMPDEHISVITSDNMEIANNQMTGQLRDRSGENLFPGSNLASQPYYSKEVKWNNRMPYWTIGAFINGWEERGYVLADISLRRFWDIIEPLRVSASGHAYIVFSNGELLAHPDRRSVTSQSDFSNEIPVKEMFEQGSGNIEFEDEQGNEYLASFHYISELGFGVVVQVPAADFRAQLINAIRYTAMAILLILIIASTVSVITTRRMVTPIKDLTKRSLVIAQGDLNTPLPPSASKDEIGVLAKNFESMRANLKQYTDNLQEMVDEKVKQNQEILSNIENGLFTVNFDGTLNPESSSVTKEMLGLEQTQNSTIQEAFQFDDQQNEHFLQWLKLVQFRHKSLSWKKIKRLCPVQEFNRTADGERKIYSVDYQKMFDSKDNMNKVMIIMQDITEHRKMQKEIEEQRLIHENEVNTILSIAKNPPEIITNFIVETEKRISIINEGVDKLNTYFHNQREAHSVEDSKEITDTMHSMFRHLHTIKGDAGSYGFDLLSTCAHESEQVLEELIEGKNECRRTDYFNRLENDVKRLRERLDDSAAMIRKLTTNNDSTVRMNSVKLDRIRYLVNKLRTKEDALLREQLYAEIATIDHQPLSLMARKYNNIIERLNKKLNKSVLFKTLPHDAEVPPNLLNKIDEALTHLIRNSMDHGIESGENRSEEKGEPVIELEFFRDNGNAVIKLRDNGVGIDPEKIAQKALQQKVITQQECEAMSSKQKLLLICQDGLSSRETVSEVSGRGVGMAAVLANLEEIGGEIDIESVPGQGTGFTITFPSKM
ncbi:cache domain-containing protein [Chitinispirillales bacterium ANBcel5]|uniref:cache domain-containing protein n=1 Tax=Cellulosispirillum alkaliphilum TaxID=3039283 RepID=UPI002A564DED|nr:cache domain-containing protein [Chitinispirillales bacterium ANBcel5]